MDGCSDAQLTRWRREMGFIYQDFALLPHLSVLENVVYPLIPRGMKPADRMARARQRLQQFQLLKQAGKRAAELSGGEMQRLAVARALAGDPKVLLADEPTSNLDQQNAELVLATFNTLRMAGTTLILATHDAQLLQLATHTIRLDGGRRVDAP